MGRHEPRLLPRDRAQRLTNAGMNRPWFSTHSASASVVSRPRRLKLTSCQCVRLPFREYSWKSSSFVCSTARSAVSPPRPPRSPWPCESPAISTSPDRRSACPARPAGPPASPRSPALGRHPAPSLPIWPAPQEPSQPTQPSPHPYPPSTQHHGFSHHIPMLLSLSHLKTLNTSLAPIPSLVAIGLFAARFSRNRTARGGGPSTRPASTDRAGPRP